MHPPTLHFPARSAVLIGLLLATALPAQRVRVMAPVGVGATTRTAGDEVGVPVEMFENPNLDRYLRAAQAFLARQDYAAAIEVLQDVIEGHTVEVVGASPGEANAPTADPAATRSTAPNPTGPNPTVTGGEAPGGTAKEDRQKAMQRGQVLRGQPASSAGPSAGPSATASVPLDARQSVFSHDGLLYRPVRSLCHELLAQLPPIGLEIYRANYEVAANEVFEQATRDGSVAALEQVINRYFITLPAGRAMVILADRLMHEGRYRVAVQVLRDLVEIYPAEHRQRLGISDVWCQFKIALCLRLAGEVDGAHAAVLALAQKYPAESLRILGELQAVKDLPESSMFAREMIDLVARGERRAAPTWLSGSTEALIPLWQYRFKNPEPYREPKVTNGNDSNGMWIMDEGMRATTMPHASRYGPATWVTFSIDPPASARSSPYLPRALFLENFCLSVVDAATGVLQARGDGAEEPPPPRDNHPRVRIASSDFALLRPIEDEARRYVVLGHGRNTTASPEALKSSELVAYQRDTLQREWSSTQWLDGEQGLRDVTFLAAPTVFGERLLLPSLRRSAYTLECLDRSTGRPLWNTPLHAGGSPFYKAPGTPVAVQGGIAYVATNAGCLAAVDAFAGDLRWIRRYERKDPLRSLPRPKRNGQDLAQRFGSQQFVQADLTGFLPNDLIVSNGLVILAACDTDLLLCVDGATGQPVWMLDATTRYAPYGKLLTIVGATTDRLFALSASSVVCIGLAGGLVEWSRELPAWSPPKGSTRGRGVVVGEWVVVPGDHELLAFDAAGKQPMQRIVLPPFDASREPLAGSCDLASNGPFLAVGYQGGVDMFSSREALRQLAEQTADVVRKAVLLAQAGDGERGEAALTAALQGGATATSRLPIETQLLGLTRERAVRLASAGNLPAALAALDHIEGLLPDRAVRLNWHLARVEICKEVGDLRAHEAEQQRLYDYMEGRG